MNAELTIYDAFQTEGKGAIASNFQEILSIARQCPQAGGPYVFIARNYLKYMGWHFDYNDAITCLQQGIFREEGGDEIENSKSTILVFPNPAGDLIKIDLVDRQDAIQAIELFDQMGRLVYSIKSQEKSPALQLNLQNLAQGSALQFTQSGILQGVYVIRCTTNKNFVYNSKLIIQK
ncbi:MAG: T9SS type A sorting domain-containing protein [Bacteroidetes bacterium]|nr:T9SS type A sorting domain-containing protein [Bacteroidota bacterium]